MKVRSLGMFLGGVAAALIVLAGLGRVSAQAAEDPMQQELEEVKKLVREQQARIDELSKRLEALSAAAQPAKPSEAPVLAKEVEKKAEPLVGYKDGFFIKSDDGNMELKLNGWLRTQYRSWSAGQTRRDDTFAVTQGWTTLTANLYKKHTALLNYDAATSRLIDAWYNLNLSPAFQVRMGRFKEPIGLENMTSTSALECLSSSLLSNLVPDRDMGLMLHGKFFDGDILSYQAGIFNGDPITRKNDSNSDKDVAARVVLRPFGASEDTSFKNMQFGVSFTEGNQDQAIAGNTFADESSAPFFTWGTGVRAYGDRSRLGFEFGWPIGPCLFKSEWISTDWDLRRSLGPTWLDEDVKMDAWSVQGSWIVTGEQKLMKLLEPEKVIDPSEGNWGCLELVARYSELDLDNDIFTGGYAAAGMWPGDTKCMTIGLNWGLAKQIKLSLNYVHSEFDEDVTIEGRPEDDEDAILFGVQVVY
jgi:phosphate-selective porin OprO/OprP